ncbi:MAG: S8 family serine peptidase, partial [Actinomycetota bacterium]|nr:S8 family serine peptidase [Actinomycetota bacterium]
MPSRGKRWPAPVVGLALVALVATPFVAASRRGDAPEEEATSAREPARETEAEPLGPLDAPVLGTEEVAFTDGRNHLVVELPNDLVEVGGGGTLLGTGDRTSLDDLSLLAEGGEIVTDAQGRTWVRRAGDTSTPAVVSSGEIPAVLADLPDTDVLRVDATHFVLTTSLDEAAVAAIPGVVGVEQDQAASLAGTNDPQFDNQWALENRGDRYVVQPGDATAGSDMRATAAWRASRGRDVVVAVIDTGVDFSHPDLAGSAWTNPGEVCGNGIDDENNGYVDDCNGWDFYRNDSSVYSPGDHTHGTNVSGVIAATTGNGIGIAGAAPEAKIMALQISNQSSLSLSTAAAAINYAVDNGADVINASWGGSGYTSSLLTAVNRARDAGVVMAVASGNAGVNTDVQPFYPAAFTHPNIVSVGASTPSDGMAYFSNYGATSVDLFAPGWYVLTTMPGNGYGYVSGTSFSAPYVAAALALMLARDPSLTPTAARDKLIATATDRNAFVGRSISGGRLDAEAATDTMPLAVSHSFTGFDALDDLGQTTAVYTVADPAALPAGALGYRVTVATQDAGAAVGVAEEPLAYTLPDGTTGLAVTDAEGEAFLSVESFDAAAIAGGAPLGISTELPGGTYALVVELVDLASMTAVGRPHAVVYDVAYTGGNDTPPDPTPPPPVPTTTTIAPPVTSPPPTAPPATAPPATTPPVGSPPATSPPVTSPASPPATSPAPSPAPTPATTPPTTVATPTLPPITVPLQPIPHKPSGFDGFPLDGGARLVWNAPSGTTPAGYRIYRDGEFVAQTANRAVVLGGLQNGAQYIFSVSAYSTGGESARSRSIFVTPLAPTPPTQPPYVAPTTAPPAPPVTEPPTEEVAPPVTQPPAEEEAPPEDDAPPTPRTFQVSPDHGTGDGGTRVSIVVPELADAEVLAVFFDGRAQRLEYQIGATVTITTRPHVAGTLDVE